MKLESWFFKGLTGEVVTQKDKQFCVFNPAFFNYIQKVFCFTHQLNLIFWVAVLIFFLSSIPNIYQGVKKAKK